MINGEKLHMEIEKLAYEAHNINPADVINEHFKGSKNIIIYGAGNAGKLFLSFLSSVLPENKIDCFLDRDADKKPEYLGYPVYKPNDSRLNTDFRKESLVILALILQEDEYRALQEQLHEMGYKKTFIAYYLNRYGLHPTLSEAKERAIFSQNIENILAAFDLMADEHSRNIFFSVFRAHAKIDYKLPVLSKDMTQYVDIGIPLRNNYKYFVDCGAYIGDTFIELVKRHKVKKYIAFEPDLQSYEKLIHQVNVLRDKFEQSILLPLCVGEKNEFLRFFAGGGGGSRLGEDGEEIAQIIRLDDLLWGYNKLLIKMDIEGSEMAALIGAKRIITETKPDLAICVYHKISDMWRIPLMLKEWVPDYAFYMRNHFLGTYETVLYATIL